ncbi:MAG: hypothetical protein HZB50_09715 [Chloroflexi bacterium]|nr:hypothetical protein [Chloroflexota bacterium]
MAKKDDNGDPIQFDIKFGRRTWIPRPVNKPNWKYLHEDQLPPNLLTSVVYIGVGLVFFIPIVWIITMAIDAFIETRDWKALLGIIILGFFAFVGLKIITMPIQQYINYKKSKKQQEEPVHKKKLPKHRKDYK